MFNSWLASRPLVSMGIITRYLLTKTCKILGKFTQLQIYWQRNIVVDLIEGVYDV